MSTDPRRAPHLYPDRIGLPGNPRASELSMWLDQGNEIGPQSQATLALAYEQRTANLLAYLNHTESDEYEPTHREIRARLGLTEEPSDA